MYVSLSNSSLLVMLFHFNFLTHCILEIFTRQWGCPVLFSGCVIFIFHYVVIHNFTHHYLTVFSLVGGFFYFLLGNAKVKFLYVTSLPKCCTDTSFEIGSYC